MVLWLPGIGLFFKWDIGIKNPNILVIIVAITKSKNKGAYSMLYYVKVCK